MSLSRFDRLAAATDFRFLPAAEQAFVRARAEELRFTQQELRQVSEMALDRSRWKEAPLSRVWSEQGGPRDTRLRKKRVLETLRRDHQALRGKANDYGKFDATDRPVTQKPALRSRERQSLGLGRCPVASPKTRCCNLMTLDAVEKCGFDCSYCSIQSFYHGDEVVFDEGFADKLDTLELDPERTYHIGTGQSSDSLMWGNHGGVLEALCAFARRYPNVVLELKTKSRNVSWLLENDVPPNVVCTWSLNPDAVIRHEEHLSATLERRIEAAAKVADRGRLVGFHFHPIVHYRDWQADYADIAERITARFHPDQVAMVSLGTLTFTKSVMRTIRQRDFHSKILQMPMVECAGKYSYPDDIKLELFRHVYGSLSRWHDDVFFYLCMEPETLWEPVFGHDYRDNDAFEAAMKAAYFDKISRLAPLSPTAMPIAS